MFITPLGIGAAYCSAPYGYTGLLIDRRIMIDAVPQCDVALRKLEINADDLSAMLITHFHADHLLGFPLLIPGRSIDKPLPVFGPAGLAKRMHKLCESVGREKHLERVQFIELPAEKPGEFQNSSHQFSFAPMQHQKESIAFSVTGGDGRKLVISGDAAWNDNLALLLAEADAAVLEMTFLDEISIEHMSLEMDLKRILAAINPDCRVLLTHLGQDRKEYLKAIDNLAAQMEQGLQATLKNVVVAEELKEYEL